MLALFLLPLLAQEEPKTLPEDKHKQLYENVCGSCHAADLVFGEPRDRQGWNDIVGRMAQMGTSASDEELDQIRWQLIQQGLTAQQAHDSAWETFLRRQSFPSGPCRFSAIITAQTAFPLLLRCRQMLWS